MQDNIITRSQANDPIDSDMEQLANMSDIELLEYVRCGVSPTGNQIDIAHDHRRFLHRNQLERLARLVQRIKSR